VGEGRDVTIGLQEVENFGRVGHPGVDVIKLFFAVKAIPFWQREAQRFV
jgi:hypothetical protein